MNITNFFPSIWRGDAPWGRGGAKPEKRIHQT